MHTKVVKCFKMLNLLPDKSLLMVFLEEILFSSRKMICCLLTQPSEMWMTNIKTTFFTKGILEGFDVIYEILGMCFCPLFKNSF